MGACKGCYWNGGTARIRSSFGIKESRRSCFFFGYIETWRKRKKCPAWWDKHQTREVQS